MPVSVMQGDPLELLLANGTHVGGSTGGTFPINNIIWQAVASLHFQITTTATVGTRTFITQFQDSSGNVIAEAPCGGGTQVAGTTERYMIGPELPFALNNSVLQVAIPYPTLLPQGSKLVIFDQANIDANDALSSTGVLLLTQ